MANIFNNIKVLTDLEVKNTATMDQGLIVSGSHSGSTGLTVKNDAIIEGELIVGGNVVNQGYAQIGALVVDGIADISGSLIVDGSGSFSQRLDVGDVLEVDGVATFNGAISGSNGLDITGNIKASADVSGSTGHFGALTAGTLSVDSLYLPGQLGVSGSAQLGQNNSSIITIAGQVSASAGIEVTTGGFNAANGTGYKLKGQETLRANATNITLQSGSLSKIQLGNLGYGGAMAGQEGVKTFSKDATAIIGPRLFGSFTDGGNSFLDVTSSYSKLYSYAGDVLLSGSTGIYAESNLIAEKQLKLSGSADFNNINVSRDGNGLYDVDEAIHALDSKINTSDTNYAKMRFFKTGSLNGSTVTLDLVSEGADSVFFGIGQINYLVADVMVRISNTEAWTNDLTSVQIYNNGSGNIFVDLDVPAAEAGWEYRMIIVNENGSMFI